MKTTIFTYKGIVGILSSPDAEGMIAKPGNGNIGCVVDGSMIEISPDALEVLKQIPRGHDGLGDIDCFGSNDGKVVFGWLGGYMKAFSPNEIETSRDYNPGLLTATENVETPKTFIEWVDANEERMK
jgi:hypothetical protein